MMRRCADASHSFNEEAPHFQRKLDVADEQIAVKSITGVDLTLTLAGPGSRSYAFVIDWHIRFLLALAWLLLAASVVGFSTEALYKNPLFCALPMLAIYILYHPILEVSMRGRTPGKRIAGVRLVSRFGDQPGTLSLIIRNLFRLIDSLPVFYLVGLVCCVSSRHHVRIGDMAAGTLLVIDESEAANTLMRLGPAARGSHLSLEALELVDQLLERWDGLEEGHRLRIARTLLARIAPLADQNVPQSAQQLRERLEALMQRREAQTRV